MVPPVLDLVLTLNVNSDTVYVSFSSTQLLYSGWTNANFCSAYRGHDYWWLNTRFGIDNLDTINVLISLYNYSCMDSNFHRDVLDYAGNVVYREPHWNGYHTQPITKDGTGDNHYISHPVIGWFNNMDAGAISSLNYIYSSKADGVGNVFYTKLDSVGNMIINQMPVAQGDSAQSWPGDSHLALDSQGNIYITWSRNHHEIVYSKSTDEGHSWSSPTTVAEDFAQQVNKPEIIIGPDDHIHFVWQHWTGSNNCLIYKKLYPNDSCCIDTTNLTPNLTPEVWAPECVIDSDTNIHIVWSPSYQGTNSLYYTLIDGKLDKGGQPASDNEITLIQEYAFYTNDEQMRYPKIITDSLDCPHVTFDQGLYGLGTTKTVYHTKKASPPTGYALFPDSTIFELDIALDTAGTYVSSFPAPLLGTYFVKVWGWNIEGEVGWDTASINTTGTAQDRRSNYYSSSLEIAPTITRGKITLSVSLSEPEEVHIYIYDILGKEIEECRFYFERGRNTTSIDLKNLSSGIYFLRCKYYKQEIIRKILRAE
jgi:hypothetical protein